MSNTNFDIANKDTFFRELDTALGKSKPASVEYIFARPHSQFTIFGIGFNPNWYGHSAIIYTMPDGTRKVFNITGINRRNNEMVHFYTPEEYLLERNIDQGGIFNRNFIGIRIENVPNEDIIKLDKMCQQIKQDSLNQKAKYDMIFGPIYNFFKNYFPTLAERGNCARWCSLVLQEANLVTKRTMWPKSIFIDIFENYEKTAIKSYDNITVVSYRQIDFAKTDYGEKAIASIELVSPFQTLRNLFYWNLDVYAHVIIDVTYPDNNARITKKHPDLIKKPSKVRNLFVNHPISATICGVSTVILLRKYPVTIMYNNLRKYYRFIRFR